MTPDIQALIVKLREKYTRPDTPPCRVCGHALEIGMAGQGRIEWHCASLAAYRTGLKWGSPEEKEASTHYQASKHIQCQFGDDDVLLLCETLERIQSENPNAVLPHPVSESPIGSTAMGVSLDEEIAREAAHDLFQQIIPATYGGRDNIESTKNIIFAAIRKAKSLSEPKEHVDDVVCECGHFKSEHRPFSDHDECSGLNCECNQFISEPKELEEEKQ